MQKPKNTNIVFCLARGYEGLGKYHYLKLVLRNLYINKASKIIGFKFDFVIFHEGNITKIDKLFIKLLSMNKSIIFRYVHDFSNQNTPTEEIGFGYKMMCRFQYKTVWNYLKSYDIAIRIDDDCLVKQIPLLQGDQILSCALVVEEEHVLTNQTLPIYLKMLNLENYYDQKFPFTNVYATRVKFWQQDSVVKFLNDIDSDARSFQNRWGDLPIIGVALKSYGNWKYEDAIIPNFEYIHLSHRSILIDGHQHVLPRGRLALYKTVIKNYLFFN
jgi:hypothetical protein